MLKNSISHTAAYIAIKFYGLSLNPKLSVLFPKFVTDYYSRLVRFLPRHLSWYHKAVSIPFWRKLFFFFEELLLPGDLMHIASRKYYLQQMVEKSINSGCEQLVILGAGFDHLGAFFSKQGIHVFEVDTPFMTEKKQDFLRKYNLDNDRLCQCPVDVNTTRIADFLRKHPQFDPDKKTLFVAEGFFDYLTLQSARSLLYDLTELCSKREIITTIFSLDELGFFHRFSFTSGVAMVGETIKLPLNRTEFHMLLKESGFKPRQIISYREMEEKLIRNSGLDLSVLRGFYIIYS